MNAQILISVAFWSACFLAGAWLIFQQNRRHTRGATWFRSGLFDLIQVRPYVVTPDPEVANRLERKRDIAINPDILETEAACQRDQWNALQNAAAQQAAISDALIGGLGAVHVSYDERANLYQRRVNVRAEMADQVARAKNTFGMYW